MKSITFTAEMVRSILEGNKTQTRRPVKMPSLSVFIATSTEHHQTSGGWVPKVQQYIKCPYGKPGDRLQVKDGPVLEITEVRLERVQDITESDAKSEGVNEHVLKSCATGPSCVYGVGDPSTFHAPTRACAFHDLWDSIYAKKPDLNWNANPYVWVVSFKVVS